MIVEDVAKCLYDKHKIEMGKNRLMDWYREKGWLTERNIPTQKSIEAELFERKPIWNEKLQKYIPTSFVTSKGLVKTLNMLSYEMKTYHRLMDGL
jgi:anti-repressor protein